MRHHPPQPLLLLYMFTSLSTPIEWTLLLPPMMSPRTHHPFQFFNIKIQNPMHSKPRMLSTINFHGLLMPLLYFQPFRSLPLPHHPTCLPCHQFHTLHFYFISVVSHRLQSQSFDLLLQSMLICRILMSKVSPSVVLQCVQSHQTLKISLLWFPSLHRISRLTCSMVMLHQLHELLFFLRFTGICFFYSAAVCNTIAIITGIQKIYF